MKEEKKEWLVSTIEGKVTEDGPAFLHIKLLHIQQRKGKNGQLTQQKEKLLKKVCIFTHKNIGHT